MLHFIMGILVCSVIFCYITLKSLQYITVCIKGVFPVFPSSLPYSPSTIYSVTLHFKTNSLARLRYITLQFVSEACLRCFPLHSNIPPALSDFSPPPICSLDWTLSLWCQGGVNFSAISHVMVIMYDLFTLPVSQNI